MKTLNFKVGTRFYVLHFADDAAPYEELLPSHGVFLQAQTDGNPLFEMTVVDNLPEHPEEHTETIGDFVGDNGIYHVARNANGDYHLRINSPDGRLAAVFLCDSFFRKCRVMLCGTPDVRRFGMENSVIIAYTYAGAYQSALTIHASVAVVDGKAYAFLGRSGTGKSTHCELWLKHIDGAVRLNDDNPVVEIHPDGDVWIYGSPWSGKTPVYKKEGYKVGGFLRLHQAPKNSIRRLSVLEGYASLMGSVSSMFWDRESSDCIKATITRVVRHIPCYDMQCLPDESAARMSHTAMTKG